MVVLEVLGEGSFGSVYKCLDERKNMTVAVKAFKNYSYSEEAERRFLRRVLEEGYDPDKVRIVRLLDTILFQGKPSLVLECLGENLLKVISEVKMELHYIRNIGLQLLKALSCLKAIGVVHADIKPENILISGCNGPALGIKLADLGGIEVNERNPPRWYTEIGTLPYMAPDVLVGLPVSFPVDMWSMALVLLEAFTKELFFPACSRMDLMHFIVSIIGIAPCFMEGRNKAEFFVEGLTLREHPLPQMETYKSLGHVFRSVAFENKAEKRDAKAFASFIRGALRVDPASRYTPEIASTHPFFTLCKLEGVDKEYCEDARLCIFN